MSLNRDKFRYLRRKDREYAEWWDQFSTELMQFVANNDKETRTFGQICDDAGISRSTFSNIMYGRTMLPQLRTIFKLAKASGYNVDIINSQIIKLDTKKSNKKYG